MATRDLPVLSSPFSPQVNDEDPLDLIEEIEALKKREDATILAHFYVGGEIQDIATSPATRLNSHAMRPRVTTKTIVFAGVHFMAESAKIMNPEKRVLLPDLQAGCSLAESCPADRLKSYQETLRAQGREFETVAYINTTAAVKSLCDWIVTSGNAREIIETKVDKNKEILFVPDQHLGRYITEVTGRPNDPVAGLLHGPRSLQPADLSRAKRTIRALWSWLTRSALQSAVGGGCRRRHRKDAAIRLCPQGADEVPGGDRSQHDPPTAEDRPLARIYPGARNHDRHRRDVCLQQVPAYGPQHTGQGPRLPARRKA